MPSDFEVFLKPRRILILAEPNFLETTFVFRHLNYEKIIVFTCREQKLKLLMESERQILTADN